VRRVVARGRARDRGADDGAGLRGVTSRAACADSRRRGAVAEAAGGTGAIDDDSMRG
jgi:hypothetical protein